MKLAEFMVNCACADENKKTQPFVPVITVPGKKTKLHHIEVFDPCPPPMFDEFSTFEEKFKNFWTPKYIEN